MVCGVLLDTSSLIMVSSIFVNVQCWVCMDHRIIHTRVIRFSLVIRCHRRRKMVRGYVQRSLLHSY